jgi:hypothetical protein|tara:strand:- start:1151 stop:1345 length:195 start_codon:yes stop_codon:yes gene_type:complete
MKKGDIVKLKDNPEYDWMNEYLGQHFEVEAIFEINCRVRMLDCPNPERYWFMEKTVFEIIGEEE